MSIHNNSNKYKETAAQYYFVEDTMDYFCFNGVNKKVYTFWFWDLFYTF